MAAAPGAGRLFESRGERLVAASLALYLIAFIVYMVVAQRGLVADAPWYVVRIVLKQGFNFEEPGRRAAELLYQWPVVLAARLGVTDLPTLGRLYAVGCTWLVFATVIVSYAFALGVSALFGTQYSILGRPWPTIRRVLKLGPPREPEPEFGPRFAQLLGFVFLALAVVLLAAGLRPLGWLPVIAVGVLQTLLALV